jgi:hypothetical protein
MDNNHDWDIIKCSIERREDGCWRWVGVLLPEGNVYRVVAEAYGAPLPAREKMYRMPECKLGKTCVNPNHLGTAEDFVLTVNGRRQQIPEPSRTATIALTTSDRRFLRELKIGWD